MNIDYDKTIPNLAMLLDLISIEYTLSLSSEETHRNNYEYLNSPYFLKSLNSSEHKNIEKLYFLLIELNEIIINNKLKENENKIKEMLDFMFKGSPEININPTELSNNDDKLTLK